MENRSIANGASSPPRLHRSGGRVGRYGVSSGPLGHSPSTRLALAIAILALYRYHLQGPWRWIYVVTALVALWFNVFVAVVQAFQKISFLNALAPTQSDPPFVITQFVVLAAFIAIGIAALKAFHPVANAQKLRPL